MIIFDDVRHLTDAEFRKARQRGVFSTDIAALLNLSKYKSALQVYLEKTGQAEPQDVTERMQDGLMVEQPLIERFGRETGLKARPLKEMHQHPKHKFLFTNLDGECYEDVTELGLLEIKGCSDRVIAEWDEQPPPYYHAQVMHQLLCTGRSFAYLYAWAWGQGTRCYKVLPNDSFFEMIRAAAEKFWKDHVLKKVPPLGDEYFCSSDDLRSLYPKVEIAEIELDASADPWLSMWAAGAALERQGEQMREQAKTEIMKQMKGAALGIRGNHRIHWTMVNQSRLDTSKLKEKEPALYQKYLLKGETRRFSITESKDKGEL